MHANATTVGYQVQLTHLAPTPVGGKVTAEATLESVEGRRLTFRVSVSDSRGLVAAGRITRVVVERERFIERARGRAVTDLPRSSAARAHAVLTLDRAAKKNALSVALRDEISDALDKLAADEAIKAVVITGAGDVFSAGFDLKEFPRALEDEAFATELWASSDRYHHAVLRFPVPTIAAVNGPALAGGFDLALLCDIRVASTTRRVRASRVHLRRRRVRTAARSRRRRGRARPRVHRPRRRRRRSARDASREPGRRTQTSSLPATLGVVARITKAPREILMRTKAKALARAGIAPGTPTLDL